MCFRYKCELILNRVSFEAQLRFFHMSEIVRFLILRVMCGGSRLSAGENQAQLNYMNCCR